MTDRNGKMDNSNRLKSTNRNFMCFYCKEKGHLRRNCPNLKADRESKGDRGQNQNQEGGKAGQAGVAEYVDDYILIADDCERSSNDWFLDSGCSYHMCPVREWFSTYEQVDGGMVLLGDNARLEVVGIGTVKLKMHDGAVRILTDVRHVPQLRRNLISLGTLESKGCQIIAEGGVMKVRRNKLVLMKGHRVGTLYKLDATTVTDNTMQWDMRLDLESHEVSSKRNGMVTIERLEIDNGLEHDDAEFSGFCSIGGIVRHRTIRRIAERMNIKKARCMLSDAGLDKECWTIFVAWLLRQSPCTAVDYKTQVKFWTNNLAVDLFRSLVNAYTDVREHESRIRNCICLDLASGVEGNEDSTSPCSDVSLGADEKGKFEITSKVGYDKVVARLKFYLGLVEDTST